MIRLTEINSNFQIFGLLNFFSSLLFLIFVKEADFIDRLFATFAINAGYFMFYFLIGKMILSQVKWLKRMNKERVFSIQKKMINLFAVCTPLFALTFILVILNTAYNTQNYSMLFAIFLPMGIYFGGNRLKTGLKKVK